jgi:hypothetical protein
MKKQILNLIILSLFSFAVYAQKDEKINLNQYQKDELLFKKYLDPTFPQTEQNIKTQNHDLADYIKQHQPIPLKLNTGNEQFDQIDWEVKVNDWFAKNPYFPRFLEYHKDNYLLNPEADIILYNTAKSEWIKRNPEKYKEISKESDK